MKKKNQTNSLIVHLKVVKGYIFHSPPKGGGLLRLSRAFSATLTGNFGMGAVRMGAEGRW
jgi:hypothetical protein